MSMMENLKSWIRPKDDMDEEEDMTSAWAVTERGGRTLRGERKEVSIRTTTQLRVVIARPRSLEELPAVADEMKSMMTVILNVEGTDRELARRMLDVLSGAAYGLDADISRIAADTYMILPFNVEFEGGLMDELRSSGLLRRGRSL